MQPSSLKPITPIIREMSNKSHLRDSLETVVTGNPHNCQSHQKQVKSEKLLQPKEA